MKPYSILIHGLGPCGEGNEQSADMALQKMLEQLRTSGHTLTSVSMVIDGSTVPIIGAMQPHPAADAPASPDAVSLSSILRQLQAIDAKCDTIIVGTKKEEGDPVSEPAPKPRASRKAAEKKEEGGGKDEAPAQAGTVNAGGDDGKASGNAEGEGTGSESNTQTFEETTTETGGKEGQLHT